MTHRDFGDATAVLYWDVWRAWVRFWLSAGETRRAPTGGHLCAPPSPHAETRPAAVRKALTLVKP